MTLAARQPTLNGENHIFCKGKNIVNTHTPSHRPFKQFAILLGAILVTLALAPATASAQTSRELGDYLSFQEQVVVGLNFGELRKSKYYSVVTSFVKTSPSLGDMVAMLDEAGVDFTKDINALALGVPSIDIQKSLDERTYSVAISGQFDSEKLLAALKSKDVALKTSELGKRTLYSSNNLVFAFPKKGILFVSSGPDAYRTRALSALQHSDKAITSTGYFKRIVGDVNTSKGLWIVANATAGASATPGTPQAKEVAMSLDFASGLAAEVLMEMGDKKSAAEIVASAQTQVKDLAKNPMVAMMGAGSVFENLKVVQKNTRVITTTRINAAQLDTLVQRAGGLIQSKLQGQAGAAPPLNTAPATAPAPAPTPKPIKADFN